MEAVKKKVNKKVTSIAWKINLMHVWYLLGKYFAMDMLVCFLGLAVFVYGMDVQQTGHFSMEYSRKLISAESLKGMVYQVYSADKGLLYQQMIGPWLYWIRIAGMNESGHMQKLVEQLLFLARSDSDRQNLDMKKQELGEILEEIYEESCMIDEAHVYTLQKREVAQLCGDFDMLKQSVRILVDNAAKYTAEGEEIILRVGMTENHLPYYEIQDNGIGISQQDLERAFDRFYRADAVRSSQTAGTGLGLSIARWITERHQGRYEIISMEGLGTRFHVEFPEWSTAHESSLREVQCAGNAPDGASQGMEHYT